MVKYTSRIPAARHNLRRHADFIVHGGVLIIFYLFVLSGLLPYAFSSSFLRERATTAVCAIAIIAMTIV